jgi:hypothetical protein
VQYPSGRGLTVLLEQNGPVALLGARVARAVGLATPKNMVAVHGSN